MIVKLSKAEIDAACREWAERHHGLVLKGEVKVWVVTAVSPSSVVAARDVALEFPDAAGKGGGPYRESG